MSGDGQGIDDKDCRLSGVLVFWGFWMGTEYSVVIVIERRLLRILRVSTLRGLFGGECGWMLMLWLT